MGGPLAPLLVASLASAAVLDADVGIRADALSTTADPSNAPVVRRSAAAAVPSLSGLAETQDLRLTGTYAPRLWSSDLEGGEPLQVTHSVEARLDSAPERPWRATARATALRGKTDLFLDPSRTAAADGASQVSTTRALTREELQAGALGELSLGPRTLLGGGAGWTFSRVLGADAGALPPQRAVWIEASLGRLLSERDTLRVTAHVARTLTDPATGPATRSDTGTLLATWRRRFSPVLEGWLGGGPSVSYSEELAPGQRLEIRPAAEIGIVRAGEGLGTTIEASLRATTFVDRFTGEASPSIDGRCVVTWRATERLSLGASASGGGRTDGATTIVAADARAGWQLRPTLSLEAGVLARAQEERSAARPSFVEAAVFASVVYRRERIFGSAEPAVPPPVPAQLR